MGGVGGWYLTNGESATSFTAVCSNDDGISGFGIKDTQSLNSGSTDFVSCMKESNAASSRGVLWALCSRTQLP